MRGLYNTILDYVHIYIYTHRGEALCAGLYMQAYVVHSEDYLCLTGYTIFICTYFH
jgi:hypothetical protein